MPDAAFSIEAVDVDVVRPLRRKLLRPDQPEDAVVYQSDSCETARHFVAKDADGAIVGIASLHFEDRRAGLEPFGTPGMRIRGVAVDDEWRGKGVGAGLLRKMLGVARKSGIQEAWANARSQNLRFYERSGFSGVSSEFEIPGIGPHVVMACTIKRKKPKPKAADVGENAPEPKAD